MSKEKYRIKIEEEEHGRNINNEEGRFSKKKEVLDSLQQAEEEALVTNEKETTDEPVKRETKTPEPVKMGDVFNGKLEKFKRGKPKEDSVINSVELKPVVAKKTEKNNEKIELTKIDSRTAVRIVKELDPAELVAVMNNYLTGIKPENLNLPQQQKEKYKINGIGVAIKKRLDIAWNLLQRGELSPSERSICRELKTNLDKLRDLYDQIDQLLVVSPKSGEQLQESPPNEESKILPTEEKAEVLDERIRDLAREEKILNEKYKLEMEEVNKALIYSELGRVKNLLNIYQEKREQIEDRKRVKNKEKDRTEESPKSTPEKNPEEPKRTENSKDEEIHNAFNEVIVPSEKPKKTKIHPKKRFVKKIINLFRKKGRK